MPDDHRIHGHEGGEYEILRELYKQDSKDTTPILKSQEGFNLLSVSAL